MLLPLLVLDLPSLKMFLISSFFHQLQPPCSYKVCSYKKINNRRELFQFRISEMTIPVVQEVYLAIILRLSVFSLQSSINLSIPKKFEKRWNFPHCLRAMVGKYIGINILIEAQVVLTIRILIRSCH